MTTAIFIDGDFPVEGSECKYYCSPTCHPGQIGPEWQYGCSHPAWPSNRYRDFCPIGMKCGGELPRCEIPAKLLKRIINGRQRRIANAYKKIHEAEQEVEEYTQILLAAYDEQSNLHQALRDKGEV